jgi:hypothetical protein
MSVCGIWPNACLSCLPSLAVWTVEIAFKKSTCVQQHCAHKWSIWDLVILIALLSEQCYPAKSTQSHYKNAFDWTGAHLQLYRRLSTTTVDQTLYSGCYIIASKLVTNECRCEIIVTISQTWMFRRPARIISGFETPLILGTGLHVLVTGVMAAMMPIPWKRLCHPWYRWCSSLGF